MKEKSSEQKMNDSAISLINMVLFAQNLFPNSPYMDKETNEKNNQELVKNLRRLMY